MMRRRKCARISDKYIREAERLMGSSSLDSSADSDIDSTSRYENISFSIILRYFAPMLISMNDLLSFGTIARCTVSKDLQLGHQIQILIWISGFRQAKNGSPNKENISIGGSPGAWASFLKASEGYIECLDD
jgi:hypothetical protein